MHPLIARIHPAFRTALFAWLLSRSALWLAAPTRTLEGGIQTPVPGLMKYAIEHLSGLLSNEWAIELLTWLPWIGLEITMLMAGVAVYRFARSTDLPQVAERVCWLWFFNPVIALTALDWGTQMAISLGALAIAGVVTHRPRRAALASVIAVGCRIEFILMWPAIAVASWIRHRPDKEAAILPLLSTFAIPVAFSSWIITTWHLAGTAQTSLRDLDGGVGWRTSQTLMPSSPGEYLLLAATATALVLMARYVRRFPLWYLLGAVPPLLWPLFQDPAHWAAISMAWALPAFVYFGLATDDRSVERPLILGFVVAFIFAVWSLG